MGDLYFNRISLLLLKYDFRLLYTTLHVYNLRFTSGGGGDGCGLRVDEADKPGATVQVCILTRDNSLFKMCKHVTTEYF